MFDVAEMAGDPHVAADELSAADVVELEGVLTYLGDQIEARYPRKH